MIVHTSGNGNALRISEEKRRTITANDMDETGSNRIIIVVQRFS